MFELRFIVSEILENTQLFVTALVTLLAAAR